LKVDRQKKKPLRGGGGDVLFSGDRELVRPKRKKKKMKVKRRGAENHWRTRRKKCPGKPKKRNMRFARRS